MKKVNKIVIGNKPLMNYLDAIVHEFIVKGQTEIMLSAIGKNVNMQERVIRVFSELGRYEIVETARRSEPFNDMVAVVCTLTRKERK